MEASTSWTLPNQDGMKESDAISDLQTLKKLYGLLDTNTSPESIQEILDDKSRAFLMKLLDEATQQTLKPQAMILPGSIITPPLSDSDQNKSRNGLKTNTNFTPVPSFHKFNPQLSFKSRYSNQSPCIKNRAPCRATVSQTTKTNTISKDKHKEKLSGIYNTEGPAQKRTQTENIKKYENSDKRAPHARKVIDAKGKSIESLSDSKTSRSDSCSHSSHDIGSLPIVPIAKRPSPSRLSKSPVNLPNEPDNKVLTRMTKPPRQHNNKTLIKTPSRHNNKKDSIKKNLEKERENEKEETKESRFKRLKNKLAVVFHHHHHHHHHHHGSNSEEEGDNEENHKHKSPWKFLKGTIHRSSERAVEIVPDQHHHMRELFSTMISHLRGNSKKRKKVMGAKRGRDKTKKLHWWQRIKKRGGVKLTDGKKSRLNLGFNSGRKDSFKNHQKH